MELNGAAIRAASTGFKALFADGLEMTSPQHTGWMDEVVSTGSRETYHFPDMLGDLREWVGDRYIEAVGRQDYTLVNKEWEKTLGIPRAAFEDDELGAYRSQIRALGAAAAGHPDKLLAELLDGGFSLEGYDDVAFFSANHPLKDGSTQSNIVSGALSETTFNTAYERLLSMKNFSGKPIDPLGLGGELVLIVGPSNRVTARDIVEKEYVDGGDSNTNYGAAKLQVFPRITDNKWFLGVRGAALRPFLLQMRKRPQLVAQDQPDDDTVFYKKQVIYGVEGRWNAGLAFWQLMVGSTGT